jgi:hypothetical protein
VRGEAVEKIMRIEEVEWNFDSLLRCSAEIIHV